ncbi:DUF6458 family protein [Nocardioides pantholopis]|uniref:DUF6458 family protein n=1 Tax=Nocardioides pantholopis TaxID=2483798 RepID=UPI000F07F5AA|nr:DUF6458 family protein [Nocardioides pantholopis]
MGYGLGVFLLAIGLILGFAVTDSISNVDLTMVGWILAGAGLLVILLTAIQMNARRSATSVSRTTHADGRQTVNEQRNDLDPPAAV